MRIGIYGGTFNPPHLGHLTAARTAFELLKPDKLYLIPAAVPPHKPLPPGSPDAAERLELTRLAGEQLGLGDRVETLDIELRREGKSYTSDTLRELHAQHPEDELWLLMGTDMFLTLHTWHEPEVIFAHAGVAAFGRTEEDIEPLFAAQRERIYRTYPDARLFTMTVPGVIDISSTELRAQLRQGTGGRYLAPAVYGQILRDGLYETGADLTRLSLTEPRPVAPAYHKHTPIPHALGLLHDCTKKLEMEEQMALVRKYDIPLDELEQKALKLLHAKTGAEIARDVFGVDDEIYRAIQWHTTGRADMSLLEKVMYLADYIEPTRDFPGVDELRRTVYEDLDRGLAMGLSMTVEEMHERGNPVHSATLAALKYLESQHGKERPQ